MTQRVGMVTLFLPTLALCAFVVWAVQKYHFPLGQTVYNHLEILILLGLTFHFSLEKITYTQRRRVNWLPPDAAWWEYLVLGIVIAAEFPLGLLAAAALFVLTPFVLPYKLMAVYVLSPHATLLRALIAFPLVFATMSLSFLGLYLTLMVHKLGNLTKDRRELYSGALGEGWPIGDTYYFSLSTMLKGAPQYEATGWCRWVALLEVAVARLLEIGVVTVGVGAILKRASAGLTLPGH